MNIQKCCLYLKIRYLIFIQRCCLILKIRDLCKCNMWPNRWPTQISPSMGRQKRSLAPPHKKKTRAISPSFKYPNSKLSSNMLHKQQGEGKLCNQSHGKQHACLDRSKSIVHRSGAPRVYDVVCCVPCTHCGSMIAAAASCGKSPLNPGAWPERDTAQNRQIDPHVNDGNRREGWPHGTRER
jgi:hypothetical protein